MFRTEKKEERKSGEEILKDFETAKQNFVESLKVLGIEETNPNLELVKAYQESRLVIDSSELCFIYKLKSPIKYENGSFLTTLKVSEPLAGQLREAYKEKNNEMGMALIILSLVSNVPLGILDRIKQSDIGILLLLVGFFQ